MDWLTELNPFLIFEKADKNLVLNQNDISISNIVLEFKQKPFILTYNSNFKLFKSLKNIKEKRFMDAIINCKEEINLDDSSIISICWWLCAEDFLIEKIHNFDDLIDLDIKSATALKLKIKNKKIKI